MPNDKVRELVEEQLKYTCPHNPPREVKDCKDCKPRVDIFLSALHKIVSGCVPEKKEVKKEDWNKEDCPMSFGDIVYAENAIIDQITANINRIFGGKG